MTSNNALQRTNGHRGRPVLAMNGVLAGAETVSCLAAELESLGLMANVVQCGEHGQQEETFVCRHLAQSLRSGGKVGFFYSSRPRGDAWCAACEEVRVREGGASGDWNERSEAFAGIQILCGACYDKVRKSQES